MLSTGTLILMSMTNLGSTLVKGKKKKNCVLVHTRVPHPVVLVQTAHVVGGIILRKRRF